MTHEEYQAYLDGRYRELLGFYDKRAIRNKRSHRICSLLVIVVSGGLVPLIATGGTAKHPLISGLFSASVVVAAAISSHFQFNENWLSYRKTWDALKREVQLHNAGIGAYQDSENPNALFVQRVEAIASDEGIDWYERHLRSKDKSPGTLGIAASGAGADKG